MFEIEREEEIIECQQREYIDRPWGPVLREARIWTTFTVNLCIRRISGPSQKAGQAIRHNASVS